MPKASDDMLVLIDEIINEFGLELERSQASYLILTFRVENGHIRRRSGVNSMSSVRGLLLSALKSSQINHLPPLSLLRILHLAQGVGKSDRCAYHLLVLSV